MEKSRILRVLDANLNRAGEALREIEDAARFGLNSTVLSQRTKELRHRLVAGFRVLGLSQEELVSVRDSIGDVGRPEVNRVASDRESPSDVLAAAFKRLQQSARSLEEFSKLLDADQDPGFELLRYASYTLEKDFFGRLQPVRKLAESQLYLLLIGSLLDGRDHETALRAAIDGGIDIVQIREKEMTDRELLGLLERVRPICEAAGVLCLVNDRADLAHATDADGVHLGEGDLPPEAARAILGPDKAVGETAHTLEEALTGQEAGADYVGFGTMFPTTTKAGLTIRGVREWAKLEGNIEIPVFAIGGIDLGNVSQLIEKGVRRIVVSSAILKADDIARAASGFRERLPGLDA